uniref:Uncharacterized protein n=1 Tax=Anguilla anguilla TaxID=7936 RepID=A0A0E9UPB5_ANGAN
MFDIRDQLIYQLLYFLQKIYIQL